MPGLSALEMGSGVEEEQLSDATTRQPKAIVDTGTTFFTMFSGLFDTVVGKIPVARCDKIGNYPNMTYELKNVKGNIIRYVFPPDKYMVRHGLGEDAMCIPAFTMIDVPEKHGPAILLGEVFLQEYFSVYDRGANGGNDEGRVGFARSVQTQHALKRLRELTLDQPPFPGSVPMR